MATATPAERYSTGAIWFHWIIAVLVIFNLIVGIFHESAPGLKALMPAHKAIGIAVLVLTLVRLAWALTRHAPPLPSHLPGWERTAAKTARVTFYILMLAMPLSGWIMVSASLHPKPLPWFGVFNVPLLPVAHGAGSPAGATHLVLGYLFAALAVLHIAAALRHQFLLRDSVLGRMIPGLAPRV